MKEIIKKNPIFFAFLLPAVTDGAVTLLGQDTSYWTNRIVNEASPAHYFLLASPWLFTIGSIFWFVFWWWIFKRLKEPINLFIMFLFIAGHSWGSTSWLWQIMKVQGIYTRENQLTVIMAWSIVILYFVLIASIATYCLRIYLDKTKK